MFLTPRAILRNLNIILFARFSELLINSEQPLQTDIGSKVPLADKSILGRMVNDDIRVKLEDSETTKRFYRIDWRDHAVRQKNTDNNGRICFCGQLEMCVDGDSNGDVRNGSSGHVDRQTTSMTSAKVDISSEWKEMTPRKLWTLKIRNSVNTFVRRSVKQQTGIELIIEQIERESNGNNLP